MSERKYEKISIEPDHWEDGDGVVGLTFANGPNVNVVRLTDADLDEVVRAVKARRISQAEHWPLLPGDLEAKFQAWKAQQEGVMPRELEWHEGVHGWLAHDGYPKHQHAMSRTGYVRDTSDNYLKNPALAEEA